MTATLPETPPIVLVGMGQIQLARPPQKLSSILGSCVGLVLYQPWRKVAVLAHVVLPDSTGRRGAAPGKFADLAVPAMLDCFASEGIDRGGVVAKLCGAANMFGVASGPIQIGEQNVAACRAALALAGIRIVAEHLGGSQGRRITVDGSTGEIEIEVAGQPSLKI